MLTAIVNQQIDGCWVCRLYEPGGYTWHGQVAHATYGKVTKDEFVFEVKKMFGEVEVE
ncbi:hypothetical protein ACX93W_26765 [Paenibacillus sp. CAU 1782]